MTSQRPLAGALDKVFPHLLILLYGLGAAVIYDHHWPFRGHGDSPILDLVEHHYPTFYKALTLWHYLPPVVVTYLAALLLPRALTLIRSWCPPWKTFLRLPWNIFLRLLNLIQISTQHTALLLFAFTVAWIHYYYRQGKRWWLRLHEKGGKFHQVPAHHNAEAYLDAYLEVAGIGNKKGTPLWRSMRKDGSFRPNRMSRVDVFRMVKRRVRRAELGVAANCHTFRATGITAYLLNGGSVENAQAIAAHESPRTTKLYDRTADEIERIVI